MIPLAMTAPPRTAGPRLQSVRRAPVTPSVTNWIYHDCVTFAQSRSRINVGSIEEVSDQGRRLYAQNVSAHIKNALVKATEERCLPRKRRGVIMRMQLRNGPARYTLGAGVAAV